MEKRKESLSALKVCRFCLTKNEPLVWLYEKSKGPHNLPSLPMKILMFIGIEIFPSDKMPQYICNKCIFYMELCHGYKQMCRKTDKKILHFTQQGTPIEALPWATYLTKVFKSQTKSEFSSVKSVTQDGSTVKVTAEEVSDSADEDEDNVYNVKIDDGSENTKNIKVITSVNHEDTKKVPILNYEDEAITPEGQVKNGIYPCDECDCTYPLEQLLAVHKNQKHRLKYLVCDECHAVVDSVGLTRHMESVHRKKVAFGCNYCPESYSNISKLARHLRTHVSDRAYPCKHCDKTFMKSHHYTRHLRRKHDKRPAMSQSDETDYRCAECGDKFNTQDELIFHSALHATESLTCPLCQEKFDDVDTVTMHIKSHVNDAEFMCDYCELIFTSQEKLDRHMMTHASDLNDKELIEDDDEYSMDAEEEYEDDSINVKEEDGHMVVEIKKAGEYILADPEPMKDDNEDDKMNNLNQSEVNTMEITIDATGPLLSLKTSKAAEPLQPKPAKPKFEPLTKRSTAPRSEPVPAEKPVLGKLESKANESQSIKKIEEIKTKGQHQSIPDKKEKMISKVESAKVEISAAVGANDLSLRLLEKELQDLKRTNSRNDVAKTPAKPNESLRIKRTQMHTSTPKPRAIEKKEVISKSAPEKPVLEKKPPGRPPKENREVKNANIKEDKEVKEKISMKEDKETKEAKEINSQVVKNGACQRSSTEEPVRRSTRPSKVKDYAKMVRDSNIDDDETSDEEIEEEEAKIADKSPETPRRGRKPKQSAAAPPPASPAAAAPVAKKRGRPRRQDPIPPKISKRDETEEADDAEESESSASTTKLDDARSITIPAQSAEENKPVPEIKTPTPVASVDTSSNIIVSPSGHTLKKVPVKALPPGVKPLPLPRKITGEVCEMQIGKKVVKVQKIVMTKAEVEAMTKKGLVEMKGGTIVLKPGIKLPGKSVATALKPAASEEQKESPAPLPKPTRCDLDDD